MMRRLLVITLWLMGCGAPAPSNHAEAPSSVDHPVTESSLPVVTLSAEARARLAIATEEVAAGGIRGSRTVGGEVVVPPGRTTAVTAPVSGVVRTGERGLILPGSTVHRGDTLFRLTALAPVDRDTHARASREEAAAQAALDTADARVTRNEALVAERAGSTRALEEARMARDIARADLDTARSRSATLRRAPLLSDVSIVVRAPEDGIVRLLSVSEGQAVPASAPLVEIVAVGALQVRVPVYVGDLGRIDLAAPASISRVSDSVALEAPPAGGPPTAEPDRMSVDRYYALPEHAALAPGERVLVELPMLEEAHAVTVPTAAIVYDAWGGAWVYVCRDELHFQRARVDPARRHGERTVLRHGPAVGTCVVSVGAAEIFGAEFAPGH